MGDLSNMKNRNQFKRSSQLRTLLNLWLKVGPEKIQVCTGFEPMICAIPVQRSTN